MFGFSAMYGMGSLRPIVGHAWRLALVALALCCGTAQAAYGDKKVVGYTTVIPSGWVVLSQATTGPAGQGNLTIEDLNGAPYNAQVKAIYAYNVTVDPLQGLHGMHNAVPTGWVVMATSLSNTITYQNLNGAATGAAVDVPTVYDTNYGQAINPVPSGWMATTSLAATNINTMHLVNLNGMAAGTQAAVTTEIWRASTQVLLNPIVSGWAVVGDLDWVHMTVKNLNGMPYQSTATLFLSYPVVGPASGPNPAYGAGPVPPGWVMTNLYGSTGSFMNLNGAPSTTRITLVYSFKPVGNWGGYTNSVPAGWKQVSLNTSLNQLIIQKL